MQALEDPFSDNPIIIPTNKYQTAMDKELKDSVSDEVWTNLLEFTESVEFVKKLIAPDRPYVKDMPKDKNGYVIVDVANPHILEDMDFFIKDRVHFDKYGYYNASKPSFDPRSEYRKYWDEQKRRCLEGYENEDTGEWISGYNYFYWNFGRIYLTVEHAEREDKKKNIVNTRQGKRRASRRVKKKGKNNKRADRVEAFPDLWEIDYFYFHYLEDAEENGEYAALLKCRGMGASFKSAGMLNRNYFMIKGSKSYAFAYADGFLTEDGLLTKTWDMEGFMQKSTAFRKNKLVSSMDKRKSGYFNKETGAEDGFRSEIMGVNTKNPNAARGKRGKLVVHEESGSHKHLTKSWSITDKSLDDKGNVFGLQVAQGCVCKGTEVMLSSGENLPIEEVTIEDRIVGFDGTKTVGQNISYMKPPAKKECVELEFYGGETLRCSVDHPLMNLKVNHDKHRASFERADSLHKGSKIAIPNKIGRFDKVRNTHARLLGLLVGDGYYRNGNVELSSDAPAITEFVQSNYKSHVKREHVQKCGVLYSALRITEFTPELRRLGMYNQTKLKKKFPNDIHLWDEESTKEFIAGYYDADGNVNYRESKDVFRVILTSISKDLLHSMQLLLQKFGIHGSIVKENRNTKPSKGYEGQQSFIYRLYINNQYDVKLFANTFTLLSKKKSDMLEKAKTLIEKRDSSKIVKSAYHKEGIKGKGKYFDSILEITNIRYAIVKTVKSIGEQDVYNLTASGTHTYIANGFITHNTGGDEASDFIGLTRLYFTPLGYNVHPIRNVFDRGTKDNYAGFFMGEYMNRPGSYNSSGVTDVIKNLVTIFVAREILEQEIDDPNVLEQKKAEGAITPLEAIVTMEESVFPKTAAKARITTLANNLSELTKHHKIGWVVRDTPTHSIFVPDPERRVIRDFPYLGKQANRAAVQIFTPAVTHQDGSTPWLRYIMGVDLVNEDEGVGSLYSFHVMDLWTDRIVATYTGRSVMVDDDYELTLAVATMYNASINYENNIKGIYAYFKNHNAMRFLAPTPQIVIDKGYQKKSGYVGNKSLGTRANKGLNSWGRLLQATWMRKMNDGGSDEEVVSGMDTVEDLGYLREISMYAPVGNYDRISAGGMLFIYREDLMKVTESTKFSTLAPANEYDSDDFFSDVLGGVDSYVDPDFADSNDDLTDF